MKIKEKSKISWIIFSKAPKERISYNQAKKLQNTTVHNFSNHYLTTDHFNILSKGLSFAPYHPFTQKDHTTIVHQFDSFSDFLRNIIISQSRNTPMPTSSEIDTETAFLYRRMKFLKGQPKKSQYPITLTNIPVLENFIVSTRIQLKNHNPIKLKRTNLSKNDLKTIKRSNQSMSYNKTSWLEPRGGNT